MEVVGIVVGRKRVFLPVERELSFCDAVGVATGDAAKVGATRDVILDLLVPADDVTRLAVTVRDDDRGDDAAVVGDRDAHARLVGEGVELHLGAVLGLAEWLI